MGDDTPLPAPSDPPRPSNNYFRQRFAQVTNPPFDPLRQRLVMSLSTYLARLSLLEPGRRTRTWCTSATPLLLAHDLERLEALGHDPAVPRRDAPRALPGGGRPYGRNRRWRSLRGGRARADPARAC